MKAVSVVMMPASEQGALNVIQPKCEAPPAPPVSYVNAAAPSIVACALYASKVSYAERRRPSCMHAEDREQGATVPVGRGGWVEEPLVPEEELTLLLSVMIKLEHAV